ncbi:efflux RND transporter permease subunit [Oerskovia turbata]|uniref:Efflux RND transporter permease subunit n=1 Tax=Oerskovia turbata TaxID=1713 RepID=A0A4Q1KYC7_9CELL|nr:efflux RND transporter permease subunit [Oerskovia turbata]RXR26806.1 efflux RND transporter permease subunit [Oerskovia turbata]RXR34539.1 efflux RND transporter permease subunit [Oerskovia turbata]TGJ97813.1 AcrB/AcrD/AcrF family protein [Actinotalea fermentans ATCC 43279 = JCM 9966 = DSM 3133]
MFRLARTSLANRAVVALATIAIAVFGVVSMGSLKQELIPSLQIPTAAVVAAYPGSAPAIVEQQVTAPLETAVRGVDGVEDVTSSSSTGMSVTTVQFTYGTDMDLAAQQLQTAVTRVSSQLPADVDPTVVTGSVDDLPVVQLAVSGGADEAALAETVDNVVVPALEEVADVRSVAVSGIADQQVTIDLDVAALAAAGLSPAQVTTILQDNGVVIPAGTVAAGDRTLSVQVGTAVTSTDDLINLPLVAAPPAAAPGTAPVTLGDVATVTVAPQPATSFSRLDGEPALAVAITKTPAGNTVEVSHAVQSAIEDMDGALEAKDVRVEVVFDQAPFIEESIEGLATEGMLGLVFAVVVILLFLTSLRSTLVSAVSIPLSLFVTFIVMNATGYTLNILTLGAMTVAIGRVVDDSIVVIENIKRHLSYGEQKTAAILKAVKEVGGAITASTVCTVAVFLPIALVGGMVGELFRPFAMTVAIAMAASLFVALTIVPVLAYWFIKAPVVPADPEQARIVAEQAREAAEAKERRGLWQRGYLPTLRAALRHPVITLTVAFAVLAGTVALVPRLETNFLGDSGQDTLTVTETFAPGTSLTTQDTAAREVEDVLLGLDVVDTVQTTVGSAGGPEAAFFGGGGSPQATFSLTLDADADGVEAQQQVRDAVADLGGENSEGITVAGADAAFGSSTVDLVVRAPDTETLAAAADQVQQVAEDTEGASEVTNNLASAQSTIQVTVDRDAAAAVGLTETQVAGTVAGLMSPSPVGTVNLGDGPVQVRVAVGQAPATVDELQALVVPTAAGVVPLTQIASVEEVEVPTSITRVNGERSATIAVTPAGQDLGTLTTVLTAAIDDLELPGGATVELGGVATQQADAFADLGLALLVAIAIVYLVMVATFRSLLQPFILLVSIPFAATGALLLLLATGTPLGVPALIGMLMLVGIVVSNAIVLIDLINQYREQGRGLDEAVMEGSRKRLRPIVMTAAATIFALTPMAIGITGGGSFISQPLALVVIGGLLSSTLLTLVVVPVLYTLAERAGEKRAARREAKHEAKAAELVGRHAADRSAEPAARG